MGLELKADGNHTFLEQTSKLQKLKKQTTRDLQKLWKDQDRNLLGENKQVQQQLKSS